MTVYKRCRMCLVSAGDAELSSLRENGGSKAVLLEKLYGINLTNDNQEALICENCSEIVDLTIAFIENARHLDETYFAAARFVSSCGSDDDWPQVCRCCQSESHLRRLVDKAPDFVPIILLITGIDVRDDQEKSWVCSCCRKILKCADLMHFTINENHKLYFNNKTDQEVAAKDVPSKTDALKLKKAAGKESNPLTARAQCTKFSKSYPDASSLKEHFLTVHEKKTRLRCNFCDFKRVYRSRFIEHITTHVDGRRKTLTNYKRNSLFSEKMEFTVCLTCQLCSKHFESVVKLARHYRHTHQAIRKFKCDHCGWLSRRKKTICNHITRMHLLKSLNEEYCKERPIKCTFKNCPMRFRNQLALKLHMNGHLGIRLRCWLCHKSYCRKSGLRRHQKTCLPINAENWTK